MKNYLLKHNKVFTNSKMDNFLLHYSTFLGLNWMEESGVGGEGGERGGGRGGGRRGGRGFKVKRGFSPHSLSNYICGTSEPESKYFKLSKVSF